MSQEWIRQIKFEDGKSLRFRYVSEELANQHFEALKTIGVKVRNNFVKAVEILHERVIDV